MTRVTAGFSRTHWPGTLRPYQATALDRLDAAWAGGRRRAWAVLPPGAGKTLIGLEAARRLARKVVVLVPNTAIQYQWLAHWRRFTPATATAGADRSLGADVTVLTYQSLAIFDPDAETDDEGRARGPMRRLHANGRELIERLAGAGPLTLVLDECHHLLDVWGRLVAEVLERLPDAMVLGLTGTPPESLSPAEAALVDTLFGTPILGASIPALVREGHLAPFAELAWLTPPTAVEADHIAGEAERFAELTTDLVTSTGFLTWLDARFTANTHAVPWTRTEKDEPRLAAAALRMHHAGLLGLPPGARMREEHRHVPSADDWVALLDDYVTRAAPGADTVEAIRRALPSVGYTLTRRGVRAAWSPVDRVLARSAAKTYATVEIAAAEGAALGERLRALVLCDHERAGARLPARLRGVLEAEAGSAWLVLGNLVADERTAPLGPMLVTGRTVAAGPATARAFLAWADRPDLSLTEDGGVCVIGGSWSARTWVRLVTAFFEEGHCRILIGTRALLGEGWDARGVNALIDLTSATTTTSVVQTRGRALRLDPSWPEKVANVWTVVCVADGHPKGAADWQRFVRKHRGYLAAAPDGEIVSGVAHVDAVFSPYAPPAPGELDAVNAAMLARASAREATREAWRLGTGFRDELVHTLRVRAARTAGAPVREEEAARPEPPPVVPAAACAVPAPARPVSAATALALAGGGATLLLLTVLTWVAVLLGLPLLATGTFLGVRRARALRRAERLLEEAAGDPPLLRFACAVADGLLATGLSRRGAEGVVARVEPDGSYRLSLADVDTVTSERFALALDEVLSPIAAPRYVMPRYVLRSAPVQEWLAGAARADGVVYHAVPAVLGQNRGRATAFARAWNTWISAGEPVYANTPEGEGVLATHRGEDPLSATTVLRVAWD
ncbi:DEAD/DEAH box helicase family protein [Actinoallomurus sp. CA-142502]|uniref:DEAD/DEAH box helicase family protein n=1 Tax=Actinoallomurus sp. CA-142502 TaxID=3239885 RepID=UPI003D8B87B3